MKFDKKEFDFDKDELVKRAKSQVRKGASDMVRTSKMHADQSKFNKAKERRAKHELRRAVHEEQVVSNARLTDHQKAALAMLVGEEKPRTMIDLTSKVDDANKQNITAAIQTLQKLGVLDVDASKTMKVNDKGLQVMKDEDLADSMGQLTPKGQEFQMKFAPDAEKAEMAADQQPADLGIGNEPIGGAPAGDPLGGMSSPDLGPGIGSKPFGESIRLIKSLTEELDLAAQLGKFIRS